MGIKPVEARLDHERDGISSGGTRGDGLVRDGHDDRQVGRGGNADNTHKGENESTSSSGNQVRKVIKSFSNIFGPCYQGAQQNAPRQNLVPSKNHGARYPYRHSRGIE